MFTAFSILMTAATIIYLYKLSRFPNRFNEEIVAHYVNLGYNVAKSEDPKKEDSDNPFHLHATSAAGLMEGIQAVTTKKRVVKRLTVIKGGRTMVVWVKLTLAEKKLKFESHPNIENR